MRWGIVTTLFTLSIVGLSQANDATATITQFVKVPAQPLGTALAELARTRGLQIIYHSEVVGGRRTAGAVGEFTPDQELRQLLQGTGLTYRYLNDKTLTIVPTASIGGATSGSTATSSANKPATVDDRRAKEGKSISSGRFRLAREGDGVDPGSGAVTDAVGDSGADHAAPLKEVIVTAEKRREPLQDVPVPVTVLNTSALAQNGQYRIQDYFATVPGLNFSGNTEGGGTQFVTIRGLSTGAYQTPTVAVMIDDVPFGNSSALNFGSETYPDIDPSDLDRIEVLRGPQGTLYGADSIGGIIKFVPSDPSTQGFSGHVEAQGVDVANGGAGDALHAGVNIPLSQSLAVRVSAFTRLDPGYVDNVTTGQRDVNQERVHGGLLSALWHVSDSVSLKLGALLQDTDGDGTAMINSTDTWQPALGDYQQTGLRGNGSYENHASLYWATLKARMGGLDFVSVSGYGINGYRNLYDLSTLYGSYAQSTFGVPGVGGTDNYEARKLTQEFRLSSSVGLIDWLAGLFYTHEDNPGIETFLAKDVVTGSTAGTLLQFNDPVRLTEYALFGDITVHITGKLDVQLGGRESEDKQVFYTTATGPLVPLFYDEPSPYVAPSPHSKGHAFTYLITPRLKLTRDLMLYARVATGYRLGGPVIDGGTLGLPLTYKPDFTTDYELGLKSDFFHHSMSLDASVYYIDWRDIQFSLTDSRGDVYVTNGGKAKSQGLEVSIAARPVDGMQVSAEASLNDAELTQSLPPESTAYGLAGTRLPYSAPFSGSVTVDQDFAHLGETTLFAGASAMYVGVRNGEFAPDAVTPRFRFPGYTTVDARTGARYRAWHFLFFVNNVANTRGILDGQSVYGVGNPSGLVAVITQPRTFGLSVSREF